MGDARCVDALALADQRAAAVDPIDRRHGPAGHAPQRGRRLRVSAWALGIEPAQGSAPVVAADVARIAQPASPLCETASAMVVALNVETRPGPVGVRSAAGVVAPRARRRRTGIGERDQQYGRKARAQKAPVSHSSAPVNHARGQRSFAPRWRTMVAHIPSSLPVVPSRAGQGLRFSRSRQASPQNSRRPVPKGYRKGLLPVLRSSWRRFAEGGAAHRR